MKQLNHILVPMDGSDISTRLLEKAVTIAEKFNARRITLLSVVDDPLVVAPGQGVALDRQIQRVQIEQLEEKMDELIKPYVTSDVLITTKVLEGNAGDIIATTYPEEEEVDLIVIGATGKGRVMRMMVGSVANYVVKNSHVDTYIVR